MVTAHFLSFIRLSLYKLRCCDEKGCDYGISMDNVLMLEKMRACGVAV